MSLLDSLKKGLFDQEDDYEDQYIDDGPQMAVSYTHLMWRNHVSWRLA